MSVNANVPGNHIEAFIKLVTPMIECANGRSRDSCPVKRKVSKRNDIVIAAMIEEYFSNKRKLVGDVGWQPEVVEVPAISIPCRGSKQEQAIDRFVDLQEIRRDWRLSTVASASLRSIPN